MITSGELLKKGGAWLGEARSWLKWHCYNGDSVTLGSQDLLNFKGVTVSEFELLAATIAAEAINDYEKEKNREAMLKLLGYEYDGNTWMVRVGEDKEGV